MSLLISTDGILKNKKHSDHFITDSGHQTTSPPKVRNSKSYVPRRKYEAMSSQVEIYNGIPGTSQDKSASN